MEVACRREAASTAEKNSKGCAHGRVKENCGALAFRGQKKRGCKGR